MAELSKPDDLSGWCRHFRTIYEKANENKKWSELAVMLGSRICFVVSPKYYDGPGDFPWQFAKSIAWMLSLHNSQAKPFSEAPPFGFASHVGSMLLAEFPQACPYCGQQECNYDPESHTSGLRRERRNFTLSKYNDLMAHDAKIKNFTLDQWAEKILQIYPRDGDRPVSELSGKLAEEYAELVRALRLYRRGKTGRGSEVLRGDYSEEFADAFSRLCVLGKRVLGEGESLDQVVWSVFKRGCPTCVPKLTTGPQCECETIDVPAETVMLFDDKELFGKPVPQNVFNIQIDSSSTASSGASAEATASILIEPGDFDAVARILMAKGVGQDDIDELRGAVGSDPKPSSTQALGARVGDWMGKMIGKAARGSWKIGSDVAVNLLTKIIAAYYGLPT